MKNDDKGSIEIRRITESKVDRKPPMDKLAKKLHFTLYQQNRAFLN